MDPEKTQDAIKSIEQMWECELFGDERDDWAEALGPLDSATVAAALIKLYGTSSGIPTIPDVISATHEMEIERQASPHVRTEPDPERMADFAREMEPWVKGWVVARYIHGDRRVFPQQKPGYDTLQLRNPYQRDYVWSEQEHMPLEDVERYIAEGAPLTRAEIFRTIGSW